MGDNLPESSVVGPWPTFRCTEGTSVATATRTSKIADARRAHDTGGSDTGASPYMARHLQVLEGLEAVRKRPGMYIGSTDSRGLMHCVWEIIAQLRRRGLGRRV